MHLIPTIHTYLYIFFINRTPKTIPETNSLFPELLYLKESQQSSQQITQQDISICSDTIYLYDYRIRQQKSPINHQPNTSKHLYSDVTVARTQSLMPKYVRHVSRRPVWCQVINDTQAAPVH